MKRLLSITLSVLLLISFVFTGFTVNADTGKSYITVVIDPGHGGDDPGSSNQTYHVNEREINLKIAQYFKAELETYDGVRVYMTRYDNTDKSLGTKGDGLRKRADVAKNYGADVLISVHCNANTDRTVRGAEAYYQNESNFHHVFYVQGKRLADGILSNLSALGLKNRGSKTRPSTDGEKYEDGHIADYYTILNQSRRNGIMGLIVEHAFISTNADYNDFLNTDAKLKKLGIADASAVAKHYELQKKQTAPLANGTYLIVPMSDKQSVLGENNGTLGFSAETGEKNQLFDVTLSGNGTYKIINQSTRRALTKKDGEITLAEYSAAAEWTLNSVKNTEFYCIRNGEAFITCDESLKLGEYAGADNQKFLFIPVSANIGDKSVVIASRLNANKVLDINNYSSANNANCQIYEENHCGAQIFNLKYENGYYTIENKGTGKLLTVNETAVNYGANVYQYESNGAAGQKWILKKNSDSSYSFISRANGLCIDIAGGSAKNNTNVQVYESNGTDAQKFILINEKSADIKEGVYSFGSAINNGSSVMDVANASKKSGGNIWLYGKNNTSAQRFRIEKTTFGYYKITSVLSGMSLDVANGAYKDGTNLQQYQSNNTISQRWIIEDNGDSTYTIISRCNGKAIDVSGGKTANGTNIQLYQKNNSLSQAFTIDGIYAIMGSQQADIDRMVQFYTSNSGYSYDMYLKSLGDKRSGAPDTLRDFCKLYCEEANAEGVNPEVAFCQAMYETGWLKYGGNVQSAQFNFAGLGATGGGVSGADFETALIGIRAQIQHLKAYASKDDLKNECVDPRFNLVERGSAAYVTDLSGKWAAGYSYGDKILALIDILLQK